MCKSTLWKDNHDKSRLLIRRDNEKKSTFEEERYGVGKKTILRKLMAPFLCLLLMIAVILGALFLNMMDEALFKERSVHISEVAEQVSEHINYIMDRQWDYVSFAEKYALELSGHGINAPKDIAEKIQSIASSRTGKIMLIDSSGGIHGELLIKDNIKLPDSGQAQYIVNAADKNGEEQSCVMFIKKVSAPGLSETTDITHIAALKETEYFEESFRFTAYSGENRSILADEQGTVIYTDSFIAKGNEGYNIKVGDDVFAGAKKAKFLMGGSLESFTADIQNRISGVFLVSSESNIGYYAVCCPIGINWMMIAAIPGEKVNSSAYGIPLTVFKFAVSYGVIIFLFCIFGIFVILYARGEEKKLGHARVLNLKLKATVDEADRANQIKTDFMSQMSHRLKTPINGIVGMINIAERHKNDMPRVEYCFEKIKEAAKELTGMVDRLIICEGEATEDDPGGEFELLPILKECANEAKNMAIGRHLEIESKFEGIPERKLSSGGAYIKEILMHLVSNAVKFSYDYGTVTLSSEAKEWGKDKLFVKFSVKDTGMGIADELKEKIFEPFVHAEEGEAAELAGSGLGLTMAHAIAKKLGTNIYFRSDEDDGSEFYFNVTLDFVPEDDGEHNIQGLKILVAEDNALNLEILRVLLTEAGADVTEALNGMEAANKFISSAVGYYDAILMDIVMPVLSGIEAAKLIRNSGRRDGETIPIIAMSANSLKENKNESIAAGMNEHLDKPLDINKVIETLYMYCKQNDNGKSAQKN